MDIEIKKEGDSNDITEYACGENPADGMCIIFYILCNVQSLLLSVLDVYCFCSLVITRDVKFSRPAWSRDHFLSRSWSQQ